MNSATRRRLLSLRKVSENQCRVSVLTEAIVRDWDPINLFFENLQYLS
jgi:hypothetical protein